MVRDMDLIREILLATEKVEFGKVRSTVHEAVLEALPPGDDDRIIGHLLLLEDAGLVELVRHQYISSPMVRRLTWEGHEFLDSIRDLKRFNEAKEEAIKLTGSAGFEVLKTILGELTKIGIRAVFPG